LGVEERAILTRIGDLEHNALAIALDQEVLIALAGQFSRAAAHPEGNGNALGVGDAKPRASRRGQR
jgi:hypothetical protein